MPCRYYDEGDSIRVAKTELDRLTKLLCRMTAHFGLIPGDVELVTWKQRHDAWDAQREAMEKSTQQMLKRDREAAQLAEKALEKLSPEEREALERMRGIR